MIQLPLPRKDDNGNSYISYSQISTFKHNIGDYYHNYVLGKRFEGNVYTEFGSKVGEGIENNDFSQFEPQERDVLKQVVRLDEFERRVELHYPKHGFYVMCFIDTNTHDLNHIIDYKTGGEGKEGKYTHEGYTQLCLYVLALRQETGITPSLAHVNFIQRNGNPGKGEPLTVAPVAPQLIPVDISEDRLKRVYWETLEVAKKMSEFYLKYKEDKK